MLVFTYLTPEEPLYRYFAPKGLIFIGEGWVGGNGVFQAERHIIINQ